MELMNVDAGTAVATLQHIEGIILSRAKDLEEILFIDAHFLLEEEKNKLIGKVEEANNLLEWVRSELRSADTRPDYFAFKLHENDLRKEDEIRTVAV